MTLALKHIPAHELATAPKVWGRNGAGLGVLHYDPAWLADKLMDVRAKGSEREAIAQEIVRLRRISLRNSPVKEERPPARPLTRSELIIQGVLEHHPGVTLAGIRRATRKKVISDARQHAAYELRRLTALTFPQIAKVLRLMDHTTVIHSVRVWPAKAKVLGIPCEPIPRDRDRITPPERTVRGF